LGFGPLTTRCSARFAMSLDAFAVDKASRCVSSSVSQRSLTLLREPGARVIDWKQGPELRRVENGGEGGTSRCTSK
jgi:hypothetical protein